MRTIPALILTVALTGALALAPQLPVKANPAVAETGACSIASVAGTASVMGPGYYAPPPIIPVS